MSLSFPESTSTMQEILAEFPSARRALFAAFHIGGCQSCAFDESDSLSEVCRQHELDPEAVAKTIFESHQEEQKLLLSPQQVLEKLQSHSPPVLIDTRTREEHEAVTIENSILLTENTLSQLSTQKTEQEIILYDHTGRSVLDQVSWFRGHGLNNSFALAGGIDAYAREADTSLPRYRLEMD